jgi:hypothetical protein
MTIADRFLDHIMGGDGMRQATVRCGVCRYEFLDVIGTRVQLPGSDAAWRMSDGSIVADYGGGLDTPEGWDRHS